MKYTIRNLDLYEDIECGTEEDNGNGIIAVCTASVTKKNLTPSDEDCLSDKIQGKNEKTYKIRKGKFLFVQGYLNPGIQAFTRQNKPVKELYDAALQLWLESIWQEIEYADNIVYVRLLVPDEIPDMTDEQKKNAGTIFQLFRRKADKSSD